MKQNYYKVTFEWCEIGINTKATKKLIQIKMECVLVGTSLVYTNKIGKSLLINLSNLFSLSPTQQVKKASAFSLLRLFALVQYLQVEP
jgi:hypothetical protein